MVPRRTDLAKGDVVLKKITVGTDGSPTAAKAVDFAIDMAQRYDAELVVASSYVPVSETRLREEQREAPGDVQWAISPSEDVNATLHEVEEKAKECGVTVVTEAREGEPAQVLVEIAEKHDADVIIVGNRGMERRVLGSVPNSVSHKAPCSVMIVKTT